MGRPPTRRRAAPDLGTPARPTPPARRARSADTGPRHLAGRRWGPVSPERARVRGGPQRPCSRLRAGLPAAAVQRPGRSCSSARRSGRPCRPRARVPGASRTSGEGRQPYPRAAGHGLGGSIPCTVAANTARVPQCPRLRTSEQIQACPRCERTRSAVVGGMVPWLADAPGAGDGAAGGAGTADVARTRRLAAARAARSRRGTAQDAALSRGEKSGGCFPHGARQDLGEDRRACVTRGWLSHSEDRPQCSG